MSGKTVKSATENLEFCRIGNFVPIYTSCQKQQIPLIFYLLNNCQK